MAIATPFPINPVYTAITLRYPNTNLVADQVLPRVRTPATFKWRAYNKAEVYTVPNTLVGRQSKPNEVMFSSTEASDSVVSYGLDAPVPRTDPAMAAENNPGYDPLARATEGATQLVLLDREVRVASSVLNASIYAGANKTTLSGTAQWSDAASDPIRAIKVAMSGLFPMPNQLVLGADVATQLQINPAVLQAYTKSTAGKGVAPLSFLADILGLKRVVIGEAFANTAKEGQTATYARTWAGAALLQYINELADNNDGLTYGYTANWYANGQPRVAMQYFDPKRGILGSDVIRVGEFLKEIVVAPECGYLFITPIA